MLPKRMYQVLTPRPDLLNADHGDLFISRLFGGDRLTPLLMFALRSEQKETQQALREPTPSFYTLRGIPKR